MAKYLLFGSFVAAVVGVSGFLRWYIGWLQRAESIEDYRQKLSDELEEKEFSNGANTYSLRQIDYIEESSSWLYKLQKHIPFLRDFQGKTTVTVRSENAPSREYVWAGDDGDDFSTYLCQANSEAYPEVEYIKTEWVSLRSASNGETTETQLRISSLSATEIAKTVEMVPAFQTYYFNNNPGDSRFQPPG